MIVLGLAGAAGSGKDTVADYLVRRYGFMKFSFSDALYAEVAEAFDIEDDSVLRDRATKEVPISALMMVSCKDASFKNLMFKRWQAENGTGAWDERFHSPREILQAWGTEYRRAQDDLYWIKRADDWIGAVWGACRYPEHRPQLFVNTSVRFPNERQWVHSFTNGQVWHLRRAGLAGVNAHVSEDALPVLHDAEIEILGKSKRVFERELHNNDSIDRLHYGIELLLSTQAKFVKVNPMEKS